MGKLLLFTGFVVYAQLVTGLQLGCVAADKIFIAIARRAVRLR